MRGVRKAPPTGAVRTSLAGVEAMVTSVVVRVGVRTSVVMVTSVLLSVVVGMGVPTSVVMTVLPGVVRAGRNVVVERGSDRPPTGRGVPATAATVNGVDLARSGPLTVTVVRCARAVRTASAPARAGRGVAPAMTDAGRGTRSAARTGAATTNAARPPGEAPLPGPTGAAKAPRAAERATDARPTPSAGSAVTSDPPTSDATATRPETAVVTVATVRAVTSAAALPITGPGMTAVARTGGDPSSAGVGRGTPGPAVTTRRAASRGRLGRSRTVRSRRSFPTTSRSRSWTARCAGACAD